MQAGGELVPEVGRSLGLCITDRAFVVGASGVCGVSEVSLVKIFQGHLTFKYKKLWGRTNIKLARVFLMCLSRSALEYPDSLLYLGFYLITCANCVLSFLLVE